MKTESKEIVLRKIKLSYAFIKELYISNKFCQ